MEHITIKRLMISFMALVLLSGCVSGNKNAETILNEALALPPASGTNHSKGMLKYYLAPDIGLKASTQTSSLLMYDGTEMMMSIKVSDIIYNYYKDQERIAQLSVENFDAGATLEGMYLDQNNQQHRYLYNEVEIGDKVAITLDNGFVSIVTMIYPAQKNTMVPAMMGILRSTQLDAKAVVSVYSNKEIIEYDTIHREFFEQEVPESGSLLDMYNQMNPDDKIE